jgi:transposase
MSKLRFVGLDVHKDSIVMAVADAGSAAAKVFSRLEWSESALLAELRKLGPLNCLRVCYEAGPTGYGLQRFLTQAKVNCVVVAPALIPQGKSRLIKTDRRDAEKLAHFLRSGDLTAIWIPDEQTEGLRDLERARDDARMAERRIRQQLLKFLLRHGRRYTKGKNHWTKMHWTWIRQQKFTQQADQRVLVDAIQTVEAATARVARLDQDIAECVEGWALAPLVKNLQAFRGIKLITAVGLAAEIGDFTRFPRATKLMAFLGLVPSEDSSGPKRRLGGITKAGNRHVRRLLIEAAWHYLSAPAVASQALQERREGVPREVIQIADRALIRLRRKAYLLMARKKASTKIATALARELVGFIWAAALITTDLPPGRSRTGSCVTPTKMKPLQPTTRKTTKQSPATSRRLASKATR